MKTTKYLKTILFLIIIFSFNACTQKKEGNENKTENTEANIEKVQYTCSMHSEVISDKPGTCPQCGMDLMKKENSSSDTSSHEGHGH